ncbi:MAG: 50S ribosomal protein L21 [Lentisphaeria bacterium]|nr:50S ribosomal protein L21 [Lentisphaeria bacterium]
MYAVIITGGKQFRVKEGDVLEVERLAVEKGETITIDQVLMVGEGADVKVGTPLVEGATVEVEVEDHYRGKKVVAFKYKKRKQYRRTVGHRQEITKIVVKSINA